MSDDRRGGVVPFLADVARRLLGPAPFAVARVDAAPQSGPAAARLDTDGAAVARQDCGPGGCGPAPYMSHEDDNGLLGYSMLGLSRDTIDIVCTEQLMRTIVGRLLDDALGDTPRLSGEHVGEATGCIEW
ncbi:MAG: hypothetical protein NTZ64_02875, partial [Polaromonas sp.]|nr:hypothetical protein [Polaromonas sp.]